MPLIVSGAPLTAMICLPLAREQMVDIRLRADENWNRRRTCSVVRWGEPESLEEITSPLLNCQFRASKVVFSMGSPTMVPSSSLTRAWAAARQRVVSLDASLTSISLEWSEALWEYDQSFNGDRNNIGAHSTPAIPSRTKFSAVIVPVLSKQQTSTRPA